MFKLQDDFIAPYRSVEPEWGFPSGPNSLGELTVMRTYSRLKDDGTNEDWVDICRRVIEGMYELQARHQQKFGRSWDVNKARRSAEEAFDRMFNFKWLPPGRGLWMMGTDYVFERGGAPLNNCAFISTEEVHDGSAYPFSFLMDMSMLGVGVGFDTEGAGAHVYTPMGERFRYYIPDSREGWVKSVELLISSYLLATAPVAFDYSLIRKKGEPINGFGGTASGPAPLMKLHHRIRKVLNAAAKRGSITSRDIVDIQNMIGACVVAGNVRRSAELALGNVDDTDFLDLKNYEVNPDRAEWGWASNNSIVVRDGDTPDYDAIAERISSNGEPGIFYLDTGRFYGRLGDEPDYKDMLVKGVNPCAEQMLESGELCTLVEVFPSRCTDKQDFLRTLKFAYLYAKTVTLCETHDARTNEIMERNRRIGTSVSGVVKFIHERSKEALIDWCDTGYDFIKNDLDPLYSDWLGVPNSVRMTTVKPSGSVSLPAGVTPGVHYPVADYYIRRIRLMDNHPLVYAFLDAGYRVEPDMYSDNTAVIELPIKGEGLPTEKEVSIFDKAELATLMARHWSDNAVSCTVTFRDDEKGDIAKVLKDNEGKWKTVSFLPLSDGGAYAQMPYEAITEEQYEQAISGLKRVDFVAALAGKSDGNMEKYCETDKCMVDFGVVESA